MNTRKLRNKLFTLIIILILFGCSKDKVEQETNSPPYPFSYIEVSAIGPNSAIINWKHPIDPDEDSVTIEMTLNGNLIDIYSAYFLDFRYRFTAQNLSMGTYYEGELIANDGKGGITKGSFSFTTTNAPTVQTFEAEGLTLYTVDLGGKLLNEGDSEVQEVGVLVSRQPYPSIDGYDFQFTGFLDDNDEFWIDIYGMDSNTLYYVRAYAINNEGVGYGEIKNFTSLSEHRHPGSVVLNSQEELEEFFSFNNINITTIGGNLVIDGPIYDLSLLSNLTIVENGFIIKNTDLTSLNGLESLIAVGTTNAGGFAIELNNQLENMEGLDMLEVVWGDFTIKNNNNLINLSGLSSFEVVNFGDFTVSNSDNIQSLIGLEKLSFVGNSFRLSENPQLNDITSLTSLYYMSSLIILNEYSLETLNGLENLFHVEYIHITGNSLLSDYCALQPFFLSVNYNGFYSVGENLENPSIQDIIDNCN